MNNVVILIPPSEGKAAGGTRPPLRKVSQNTQAVLDLWRSVSTAEWGKLLGVKEKALEKAIEAKPHHFIFQNITCH